MNTLKAEKRSMDVKAKRLRREGYVTGNVFGREIEGSIPVKMLKNEVDKLLKTDHKGSQVMLEVDLINSACQWVEINLFTSLINLLTIPYNSRSHF